jgi:flagellar biogenesis protein FliO
MSPLGQYVVQTAVTLVGIALLAWLVINFGRRVGLPKSDGTLRLRGRLALDARRCVYLVEVGDRVLVLGAGEGGISKLAELPGDALPEVAWPRFNRVCGSGSRRRTKRPPCFRER